MTIGPIDPRLRAATLTREEFVGCIQPSGDASSSDGLLEVLRKGREWEAFEERALLEPVEGYTLRYNLPHPKHRVYLLHDENMVGFFP